MFQVPFPSVLYPCRNSTASFHERKEYLPPFLHIPPDAKVFLPASIEQSVWQYFSAKAQQKGVDLSELLTDVLKRDIEINEALK